MAASARSSIHLDLFGAYLASFSKVAAWAAATSAALWYGGEGGLATLAVVRSTIGLLSYAALGLTPALIHHLAQAARQPVAAIPLEGDVNAPAPLTYAGPIPRPRRAPEPGLDTYITALLLSWLLAIAGGAIVWVYSNQFSFFHHLPNWPSYAAIQDFVFGLGLGYVLRLGGDASGARIRLRGWIWLDCLLVAAGELLFALLAWRWAENSSHYMLSMSFSLIGTAYFVSGFFMLIARFVAACVASPADLTTDSHFNLTIAKSLIAFGCWVTLAQLADFLYAPTDFILINRFLDTAAAAAYTPAVQIDAALLLIVSGVAAILLPRSSLAHAAGNRALLRRYYIQGTIFSTAAIFIAAIVVWIVAPALLRVWLRQNMPGTVAVLPLVLIHTVVGGSSAVGRSILLGIGKTKPLTAAALVAGISNVLLSFIFVRFFHLGLPGIIYGTIVAVVGRCGIWMPWYIARTLRRGDMHPESGVESQALPELA